MRVRFAALFFSLGITVLALGQAGDSRGTATTTIGGKKVSIDYGQPALKGRNFDELMKQLPGDRMWRAGSGAVTILSTETALKIGGKKVPAGKYSVYVHCAETGPYSLVLNSDLGQPLGKIWSAAPPAVANQPYPHFEYNKEISSKEVARAALKKASVPATDVLIYTFQTSSKGATLTLAWGDQAWSLEILAAN
jgi:hypothetical protein